MTDTADQISEAVKKAVSETMSMSAARLNEIGNLSVQQAIENSGRLSSMMGIRAAQTNPIEASSIETLKQAGGSGNAQLAALAAMISNLANRTPTSDK